MRIDVVARIYGLLVLGFYQIRLHLRLNLIFIAPFVRAGACRCRRIVSEWVPAEKTF